MSSYVSSPTKTFTATGTLGQYLRVKNTGGTLSLAGANEDDVGTVENPVLAAGPATVRLRTAQGTMQMVASGAVSSGSPVYAAASGKVAATGTQQVGIACTTATADNDVIEVVRLESSGGNLYTVRTRVTTAQVNAGLTLLPAVSGLKWRVVDSSMIAIGGAASGATTVDLVATQGAASVKLVAAAVAGLTQNALLRMGAANSAILAGGVSFVQNDANTAVSINKTGSDLATSTHIDVLLLAELSA